MRVDARDLLNRSCCDFDDPRLPGSEHALWEARWGMTVQERIEQMRRRETRVLFAKRQLAVSGLGR
jgi:hypothetical protein